MSGSRGVRPQSPACDRCSQGVMDAGNPHLWGECLCECHRTPRETVARKLLDAFAEATCGGAKEAVEA